MIELVNLYWKLYRLVVAIAITVLIIGVTLLSPLFNSESYNFLEAFKHSAANIGLYLIMTPVFMMAYFIYKKQQLDKNTGYKIDMPEIFNIDTFLKVYTIYATLAYIAGFVLDNAVFK